ncbi:MAG: PfkB family carbohydrate kinase [Anaerolineae bacterium]|nr:PfkB family carbohydrate kinase [Anaerolineae bacterium]NUQ02297.1 hypothetical protein [Anaerolineae bacterium]
MTADYVLIGHITADLTPQGRIAGGTVSYAARTAAAFGWRVGIVTSCRPDEPLLDPFRSFADIHIIPADETTTYENIYTDHGRLQYVRGRAGEILAENIPDKLRSAPLVHLAPIADEIRSGVAAYFGESTILATLQGWMRQWGPDQVVHFKPFDHENLLKRVDVVVFSEEDIAAAPETEAWVSARARHTFVTRAEKGGSYYHDGQHDSYTTPKVSVVEPTGAGDVFAASLLASLPLVAYDMSKAIRIAARLAANAVTRPGIQGTPSADEVRAVLETI